MLPTFCDYRGAEARPHITAQRGDQGLGRLQLAAPRSIAVLRSAESLQGGPAEVQSFIASSATGKQRGYGPPEKSRLASRVSACAVKPSNGALDYRAKQAGWLSLLLGCHLSVISGVDDQTESRARVSGLQYLSCLSEPMEKCAHVLLRVGMGSRDKRMTKASCGKFIGDLHERVAVSMSEMECIPVEAVAEAIVENRLRTSGHRRCQSSGEHRLSHACVRVNYDRALRRKDRLEDRLLLLTR